MVSKLHCVLLVLILLHEVIAMTDKLSLERIQDCLQFAERKRVYSPTTIRIATFSEKDAEFITQLEPYWKNPVIRIAAKDSSILKPQERKNRNSVQIYTFITLITVLNPASFEEMSSMISRSVDPKRDFVIFVCNSELIQQLRKWSGLREKMIVQVDATGIWVEPTFHNGDMIKVDKLEDIEIITQMGRSLRGRHIKAAAPETPPYNFKSGEDSEGNAIIDGSLCRIFLAAAEKFNYTYYIKYEGFDYGTLHENGTWTGSYSKIHYPDSGYDIDMIFSSEILWAHVDAASMATQIDMMFGVAHPIAQQHWYAFLLPFDTEVWIWFFVTFISLGTVQGIVMWMMQGRKLKPIVYDSTSLLPFAIIMEQGLQDIPRGMRYFSLILLFGCTVLGTGYKSTLRTHLMFPKADPVPTTFQELADRVDYSPTLTVLGALEKHFWETSEVNAVKKIRQRLTFDNNWANCYKNTFLDKKKACISWIQGKYVVAKTLTLNTTIEPLVYSKDAAITKFLSLGFQENSIYVDSFSPITGQMGAMGIVTKWEEDILNSFKKMGRQSMLNQSDTEVFKELIFLATPPQDQVPLKLDSLFVVIGFIPAGALLGAVAFAFERYHGRNEYQLRKNIRKTPNQVGDVNKKELPKDDDRVDIEAIQFAD